MLSRRTLVEKVSGFLQLRVGARQDGDELVAVAWLDAEGSHIGEGHSFEGNRTGSVINRARSRREADVRRRAAEWVATVVALAVSRLVWTCGVRNYTGASA